MFGKERIVAWRHGHSTQTAALTLHEAEAGFAPTDAGVWVDVILADNAKGLTLLQAEGRRGRGKRGRRRKAKARHNAGEGR